MPTTYNKAWYEANKDKYLAYQRAYRLKPEVRAKRKAYYEANKEEILQQQKEKYHADIEENRRKQRERYARLKLEDYKHVNKEIQR